MAGIKYWLWLRTRHGLSNQICTRLLEQFGDPEKIYFAAPEDYLQTEGVTKAQLSALADKKLDRAEAVLEDCERLGVRILSRTDATYPSRLRAIPDAPCVLYYKGIWPDFDSEAAVALIGTRKATPYGIRIGERLGYELSKGGAYVVSGLAAGGDAAGHRGALLAGARTAAVLGGGIDVVYPAENRALFEDIAVNGVLISEYPPGTPPLPGYFPQRNRIIAGLADYVIVMEARKKSGSLITADYAMEQGKEVYALPGRVTDALSEGTNHLIQQGAGIFVSVEDFLQELQLQPQNITTQIDFRKNLLEKDESLVYALLDFYPVGLGTLIEKSPYGLVEILPVLERLEQKGFIQETIPNYYIKTI